MHILNNIIINNIIIIDHCIFLCSLYGAKAWSSIEGIGL